MIRRGLLGVLAGFVGFASSFAVVLAGFSAMGATPAQAASGLAVLSFAMGALSFGLSVAWRMPVSMAWSTPGAALLVATAPPAGGFPAAIGAFLVAALLLMLAGLLRPVAALVTRIPAPLAAAMLAGILLELCLAPVRAAVALPWMVLPVLLAWAVTLRLARLWAVPVALLAAMLALLLGPGLPAGAGWVSPQLAFVLPRFEAAAMLGIALPLFLVTMASQNLPGLAVLQANGYAVPLRPVLLGTGAASAIGAFLGGHLVNMAAITAALCAGPEADPDPRRRWQVAATAGAFHMALAFLAGTVAVFAAAVPPLLIQAVAGLALLGALAAALQAALADEALRLPATVTFLVAASSMTALGIGAAFWGLLAGGALAWWLRR